MQGNSKTLNSTFNGIDMSDYKNVYYWEPGSGILTGGSVAICVDGCPDVVGDTCLNVGAYAAAYTAAGGLDPIYEDAGGTLCQPGGDFYDSTDFFGVGGRCFPEAGTTEFNELLDGLADIEILQQVISDFGYAWREMLYIAAGTFVVAFIFILLMRCMVAPLVYTLVIGSWFGLFVLTLFLFTTWRDLEVRREA